MKVRSFRELA